jgi:hypothetical protein
MVNGAIVLQTPVQSETLEPTWPNGPKGNFRIGPNDKLRVELWDANPINDKPIGVRDVGRVTEDQLSDKRVRVELDGGAELELAVEPAHAMEGLGLWYELRTTSVYITRLLEGSPAKRAGIEAGDEVIKLSGREVNVLTPDEVRSFFNAVPLEGLPIGLRKQSGTYLELKLKEGPVYPPFDQFGSVE